MNNKLLISALCAGLSLVSGCNEQPVAQPLAVQSSVSRQVGDSARSVPSKSPTSTPPLTPTSTPTQTPASSRLSAPQSSQTTMDRLVEAQSATLADFNKFKSFGVPVTGAACLTYAAASTHAPIESLLELYCKIDPPVSLRGFPSRSAKKKQWIQSRKEELYDGARAILAGTVAYRVTKERGPYFSGSGPIPKISAQTYLDQSIAGAVLSEFKQAKDMLRRIQGSGDHSLEASLLTLSASFYHPGNPPAEPGKGLAAAIGCYQSVKRPFLSNMERSLLVFAGASNGGLYAPKQAADEMLELYDRADTPCDPTSGIYLAIGARLSDNSIDAVNKDYGAVKKEFRVFGVEIEFGAFGVMLDLAYGLGHPTSDELQTWTPVLFDPNTSHLLKMAAAQRMAK